MRRSCSSSSSITVPAAPTRHTTLVQDSVSTAASCSRHAHLWLGAWMGNQYVLHTLPTPAREPELAQTLSWRPTSRGNQRLTTPPGTPRWLRWRSTGCARCASTRTRSHLLLDATSVCAAPPCGAFSTTRRLSLKAHMSQQSTHTSCMCRPCLCLCALIPFARHFTNLRHLSLHIDARIVPASAPLPPSVLLSRSSSSSLRGTLTCSPLSPGSLEDPNAMYTSPTPSTPSDSG